jgi:hypothetical protein
VPVWEQLPWSEHKRDDVTIRAWVSGKSQNKGALLLAAAPLVYFPQRHWNLLNVDCSRLILLSFLALQLELRSLFFISRFFGKPWIEMQSVYFDFIWDFFYMTMTIFVLPLDLYIVCIFERPSN